MGRQVLETLRVSLRLGPALAIGGMILGLGGAGSAQAQGYTYAGTSNNADPYAYLSDLAGQPSSGVTVNEGAIDGLLMPNGSYPRSYGPSQAMGGGPLVGSAPVIDGSGRPVSRSYLPGGAPMAALPPVSAPPAAAPAPAPAPRVARAAPPPVEPEPVAPKPAAAPERLTVPDPQPVEEEVKVAEVVEPPPPSPVPAAAPEPPPEPEPTVAAAKPASEPVVLSAGPAPIRLSAGDGPIRVPKDAVTATAPAQPAPTPAPAKATPAPAPAPTKTVAAPAPKPTVAPTPAPTPAPAPAPTKTAAAPAAPPPPPPVTATPAPAKAQPAPQPAPQVAARTTPDASTDGTVTLSFAQGSPDISDADYNRLDSIAKTMTSDTGRRVRILSHASDTSGNANQAKRLSLTRALNVRAFLMDQGVPSPNIEVRAMGSQDAGSNPDRVDVRLSP